MWRDQEQKTDLAAQRVVDCDRSGVVFVHLYPNGSVFERVRDCLNSVRGLNAPLAQALSDSIEWGLLNHWLEYSSCCGER